MDTLLFWILKTNPGEQAICAVEPALMVAVLGGVVEHRIQSIQQSIGVDRTF